MGPGTGLDNLLGNQSKEKMSREQQEKQWREQTEAFRQWYNETRRIGVGKKNKVYTFEHRTNGPDPDLENDPSQPPTLAAGDDAIKKKPKAGIYAVKKNGEEYGFDLYYSESGSVRPIPFNWGEVNTKGWSKAIDFLAGELGHDTIKISLPANPNFPERAKRNLNAMMSAAAKKGVGVEFDQATMEFIASIKSQSERKRIFDYQKAINARSEQVKWWAGQGDTKAFEKSTQQVEAQHEGNKLKGANPAAKETEFKAKLPPENASVAEKLKALDEQHKKLAERLKTATDASAGMIRLKQMEDKLIKDPQAAPAISQRVMKSTAYYSTAKSGFKEAVRATLQANTPEEKQNVLKVLGERSAKGEAAREKLRDVLQKELRDIQEQRELCGKELDKMNVALAAKKSDAAATPDDVKKAEEQIKQVEERLQKFGKLETDAKSQLSNVDVMSAWEKRDPNAGNKSQREHALEARHQEFEAEKNAVPKKNP